MKSRPSMVKLFDFIVLSVHNSNIKTLNMFVYKILKLLLA
jgi:hypothetical protein